MTINHKFHICIIVCILSFCFPLSEVAKDKWHHRYSMNWYDSDLKLLITFYSKEAAAPIEAIDWHMLNGKLCSISLNGVVDFKWSSDSVSTYLYRKLQNVFPGYDEYFGGRKTIAVLLDNSMDIIESRIVAIPLLYYKKEGKNRFDKQIDSVFADFGRNSKGEWIKKVPTSEEEHYVGFISVWCY